MIRNLDRIIPAAPDRPERGNEDHPMRKVTRQVAFEESGWTPERAVKVRSLFDELAPEWHTRSSEHRFEPVGDALDRGGPIPAGLALELGSGTGLLTEWLSARFPALIAVDLSLEMLRLAPATPPRLLADGSRLPLRDGAASVVLLINMLLFPAEVDRVLAPDGALVWVNTSGDRTPIHLSAEELDDALPGAWHGVAAEAGWGTWAVLRRA